MAEPLGVTIDEGPTDWRIIQQDGKGTGAITLSGRWHTPRKVWGVYTRLVYESSGHPVTPGLAWRKARTNPDGTWSATLRGIPAGGLYRLETHLRDQEQQDHEYAVRGDVRHFLGVGDLWVIAGQSNAAGYGRGPVHDPPALGVHLLSNALRWQLAAHPLHDSSDIAHEANRDQALTGHSPWLHFGKLLQQALGYPVGLIMTAKGGSALAPWMATSEDHCLFDVLAQSVEAAGGKVRGIAWYQGESDGGSDETSTTYLKRFGQAVRQWRKALGSPQLPVLTVQLARQTAKAAPVNQRGWSRVREAQRQAAQKIPGVSVVPANDLPVGDAVHVAAAGTMILGERMARLALERVYDRPCDALAPDLVSAQRKQRGKVIELRFEHVQERFRPAHPQQDCFAAEDEEGAVAIDAVQYTGGPLIRLRLGRSLVGRAVVHGAHGTDPPPAPVDMPRLMPMLSFSGVEVE